MTPRLRVALGILGALVAFAVGAPWLLPDPLAMPDLAGGVLQAPSAAHLLGTDQYSRDVLSRLARGARISLSIAAIATAVALLLGCAVGVAAGLADRGIAALLRRVIDVMLALPRLVVLLVVLAATGAVGYPVLAIVLGATGWPAIARLVRGETMRLRHAEYVGAAHALGAPAPRVVVRDILPGAIAPALVAASLGVADVILLEAGLSFLGIGVRAPEPSWGNMILDARDHLRQAPWLVLAPTVALVVATSAATLLGDALRRTLQPHSR